MALVLGGEFELKDVEIKTSVKNGRKIFMKLILDYEKQVAFDLLRLFDEKSVPKNKSDRENILNASARLFLLHTTNAAYYSRDLTKQGYKSGIRNTPVLAYFDFIFKNQSDFEKAIKESKEDWKHIKPFPKKHFINRVAIEKLIPDWKTLQARSDSHWLCSELKKWSKKWNLTDDWCLDFALNCLKDLKIEFVDKLEINENFLAGENTYILRDLDQYLKSERAWKSALDNIDDNFTNYIYDGRTRRYCFKYDWLGKTEKGMEKLFSVNGYYNPLSRLREKFRKEIEHQFFSQFLSYFCCHQDSSQLTFKDIKNEFNEFQTKVNEHIEFCETRIAPDAQKTFYKEDGDRHFRWLIEYQILGYGETELSDKHGVDRSAIAKGKNIVSKLIGLTLRKSDPKGRPSKSKVKDSKTTKKLLSK